MRTANHSIEDIDAAETIIREAHDAAEHGDHHFISAFWNVHGRLQNPGPIASNLAHAYRDVICGYDGEFRHRGVVTEILKPMHTSLHSCAQLLRHAHTMSTEAEPLEPNDVSFFESWCVNNHYGAYVHAGDQVKMAQETLKQDMQRNEQLRSGIVDTEKALYGGDALTCDDIDGFLSRKDNGRPRSLTKHHAHYCFRGYSPTIPVTSYVLVRGNELHSFGIHPEGGNPVELAEATLSSLLAHHIQPFACHGTHTKEVDLSARMRHVLSQSAIST